MHLQNLTLGCWLLLSYSLWNQCPRMEEETWSRRGWGRGTIFICNYYYYYYYYYCFFLGGGTVLVQTLFWTLPPPPPKDIIINNGSLTSLDFHFGRELMSPPPHHNLRKCDKDPLPPTLLENFICTIKGSLGKRTRPFAVSTQWFPFISDLAASEHTVLPTVQSNQICSL